ncbi:MAG: peptidylprolyl isomerase [Planctomycetes bacterium]|nr:peptidylprolyl isomerase [Planctomycetota bacterium]
MTTKTPESRAKDGKTWWERLTDASTEKGTGQQIFKYLIIAAVVAVVGIGIWSFVKGGTASSADERSDLLDRASELLPEAPFRSFVGVLPHHVYARQNISIGFTQAHNLVSKGQTVGARGQLWSSLQNAEDAATYVKDAESMVAELRDRSSLFENEDSAWRYYNTIQQLYGFAALNGADAAQRKGLFEKQLAVLADMKPRFKDHQVLGLHPDPLKPDRNVLELWEDFARAEIAFIDQHGGSSPITADEGLTVSMELSNDAKLGIELYSLVAPKGVATFVRNIQNGTYDGTAVHKIDKASGALHFGDPFTRLAADRKFIWHKADTSDVIPLENSPRLKPAKGMVALESKSGGGHPFHFVVYLKDPENPISNVSVIGKVTEGLDAIEAWLETELHDEPGLENPQLPRVRLGVKAMSVTGEIQHPSDDSWRPKLTIPEIPEESEAEKNFMKVLAGPPEEDPEPAKDSEEKPPEDG